MAAVANLYTKGTGEKYLILLTRERGGASGQRATDGEDRKGEEVEGCSDGEEGERFQRRQATEEGRLRIEMTYDGISEVGERGGASGREATNGEEGEGEGKEGEGCFDDEDGHGDFDSGRRLRRGGCG
ncbi:hypothetical protein ACLOJK_015105 [Asimina triloba]